MTGADLLACVRVWCVLWGCTKPRFRRSDVNKPPYMAHCHLNIRYELLKTREIVVQIHAKNGYVLIALLLKLLNFALVIGIVIVVKKHK